MCIFRGPSDAEGSDAASEASLALRAIEAMVWRVVPAAAPQELASEAALSPGAHVPQL